MSHDTATSSAGGAHVAVTVGDSKPPEPRATPEWLRTLVLSLGVTTLGSGGGAATLAALHHDPAPVQAPPVILRVEFDQLQRLAESSERRIKAIEDQRQADALDTARWRTHIDDRLDGVTTALAEIHDALPRRK